MSNNINNMNKTLCVLANSKVGDLYASRIVSMLKTRFGVDDIKLIGNGGEHMNKDHNMRSIIDLNDLREKPMHLWRYDTKSFLSMKYHPANFYQHSYLRPNMNLIKLMKDNEVYDNIVRARPSCIIGLDNEYLSREMLININQKYGEKFKNMGGKFDRKNRPDCFMLTNTARHWDENFQFFCDTVFYTYALKTINRRFYNFPSQYIGQYGAYDAIRHIYQKSGLFNHYVKENSILASREHSLDHIEKCRIKIKDEFRNKHKIDQEATVVFFAPGDTIGENKYTLEAFRRGYNEYVLKNAYPTSLSHYAAPKSMFKLVISIHKGTESEAYIREFLQTAEFEAETIIVTNDNNEHFDAICASDFGTVYNGQLVSSAAALHLNFFTMQNMNDLHYFWHTWENRWLADINVNADRPAVKEMAAGEFWYGKICEELR